MKKSIRLISLLLVLAMCLPLSLFSCDKKNDEYTLPLEDGYNQLTFYWTYSGGEYSNCDMWRWFPGADGRGYTFHECEYGGKVVINVPEDIAEVGFIVRKNCSNPGGTSWDEATKDYDQDRFAVISGRETVIYLKGAISISTQAMTVEKLLI